MQDLSDQEQRHILGEALMDQLKAILEYVADIPEIKQKLIRVEKDVTELKRDMKVVKVVLKDHSMHSGITRNSYWNPDLHNFLQGLLVI